MSAPRIGIMQGRLLPPLEGRYQAFPVAQWRDEFPKAAAAGLACIEWIYEKPNEDGNPLASDRGIAELSACALRAGVGIWSICADYYMTEHLVDSDGVPIASNVAHLTWLIGRAAKLGVTYMVLPFVDSSSLRSREQISGAIEMLRAVASAARSSGIELHVECDLPPADFRDLLDRVGNPFVKANFDIGNSASLGYRPEDELPLIAPHLGSVHVKDRKRGGGSVPLGSGDADLMQAFRKIKATGFDRWLILQLAREEAADHVELARRNRLKVEELSKLADAHGS